MLKRIFYILFISTILSSCHTDTPELPDILIDEVVYLNNPSNIKLQSPGGWAYLQGGIRGIIVYRVTDTKFKAYERSCPHLPPSDCTFLDIEDDIRVICRCDKMEFLIVTGEPLNGASLGLKEYRAYYDEYSQTVHIVN